QIQRRPDFVEVLSRWVLESDVVVVIIGRSWISVSTVDIGNNLDDPNDFVRLEIEAAFKHGIPVIPVLVDGAKMPSPHDLPLSLKGLSRRQWIEIPPFDADGRKFFQALSSLENALREVTHSRAELKAGQREGADTAMKVEPARRV